MHLAIEQVLNELEKIINLPQNFKNRNVFHRFLQMPVLSKLIDPTQFRGGDLNIGCHNSAEWKFFQESNLKK